MTQNRKSLWTCDTQGISDYPAPHLNPNFTSLLWESMTHQEALTTQFWVATLGLKIHDKNIRTYTYYFQYTTV
jgi:hypothetical protein